MAAHVEPAELLEYTRGRLPQARAMRVRLHCWSCAECGDQLAAVLLLRQALLVPSAARWDGWRRAGIAAGLWVLVGAGVFFAANGGGLPGVVVTPVAKVAPQLPRSSAGVADSVAAAAARHLDHLAGLRSRRLRARVTRTAAVGGDRSGTALDRALELVAAGRFAEVATTLKEFSASYDATGTPWLALASVAGGGDGGAALEAVRRRIVRLLTPAAMEHDAPRDPEDLLTGAERAAGLAAADRLEAAGRNWQALALLQLVAIGEGDFADEAALRTLPRR